MPNESRRCMHTILCSLLFAISSPALIAQDLNGWQADSAVTGVQLDSVKEFPGRVLFNLKNVSKKPIIAIVVIAPDRTSSVSDYFGWSELAPGSVKQLSLASQQFPDGVRVLKIAAVVFADGTTEGSQPEIDLVTGQRLGSTLETARFNAILATLPVEYELSDAAVDALVERVGRTLPASLNEVASSVKGASVRGVSVDDVAAARKEIRDGFLVGVRNAREVVLWELEELKQLPPFISTAPDSSNRTASRDGFLAGLKRRYAELQTKQETQLKGMNVEGLK